MKKRSTLANDAIDRLIKNGKMSYAHFDFTGAYEESQRRNAEALKEQERIEKERIDAIPCPSCGSTNKKHVVKRDSNGICGPGYSSWITDEYFVCKECGTRFEDLTKINDD